MSSSDGDRFAIGQGRPRPEFKPKTIHCSGCGAGLGLKNESTQTIVCQYCGSQLELAGAEQKVLGMRQQAEPWQFPIELGERFRHKGHYYEVIARIAYREVGEPAEPPTRQYLLFNPRLGSLWLGEYAGHYDLTESTHVMPGTSPFGKNRGDVVTTYDGREWLFVESCQYEIGYVDGALPWVAQVGDRVQVAELHAKDGSGEVYEVEAQGQELEYGLGRRIPVAAVRSAMQKRDIPEAAQPLEDVAERVASFKWMIKAAAIALLVNGVLLLFAMAKGSVVLEQSFDAGALSGETLSKPFEVSHGNSTVRIDVACQRLNNAWMAVDVAVVQGDDTVIHTMDEDIEYYHGVEGGESWSEGSKDGSHYFRIPDPGTHRLLVHAVSGMGSAAQSDTCSLPLKIRVVEGAMRPVFFVLTTILSLGCLLLTAFRYGAWKSNAGEEED